MREKGSRGRWRACLAPADVIALAPRLYHRPTRHNSNALRKARLAALSEGGLRRHATDLVFNKTHMFDSGGTQRTVSARKK
eukprot:scaffold13959_cov60-Phaeocystis_antarctica.AAC.1